MISIEELIEEEDNRQGLMVDFDVYAYIDKIYDSIGSCEKCSHDNLCGVQETLEDQVKGFCSDFKQKDK
jgi:hypothetical protein